MCVCDWVYLEWGLLQAWDTEGHWQGSSQSLELVGVLNGSLSVCVSVCVRACVCSYSCGCQTLLHRKTGECVKSKFYCWPLVCIFSVITWIWCMCVSACLSLVQSQKFCVCRRKYLDRFLEHPPGYPLSIPYFPPTLFLLLLFLWCSFWCCFTLIHPSPGSEQPHN